MRVVIGKIRAAHAIRGEVKIETYDVESESMRVGKVLWIAGETDPRKILDVRVQKTWRIVALEGVVTRNQSEALNGREVFMEREALPTPDPNEFYIADVMGFAVVTLGGERVGSVTGSAEGAQTLLLVAGEGARLGKELMIPCVEGIVLEIDRVGREVRIDPPDGLLDL